MIDVMSKHKELLRSAATRLEKLTSVRKSIAGVVAPERGENWIPLDRAQKLMPGSGALSKDATLHWRWKVVYPRDRPPYYVT